MRGKNWKNREKDSFRRPGKQNCQVLSMFPVKCIVTPSMFKQYIMLKKSEDQGF